MPPPADEPNFRTNPEVDAKIDAHIKENPKYWNYIQAMPRDRLERTVVLNEVRELDRQQRMREGMMKQHQCQPCAQERLRNAGERPARRPEGRRHRPNRPHRPARGCPRARPATSKNGGCHCLNTAAAPRLGFPDRGLRRLHFGVFWETVSQAAPGTKWF